MRQLRGRVVAALHQIAEQRRERGAQATLDHRARCIHDDRATLRRGRALGHAVRARVEGCRPRSRLPRRVVRLVRAARLRDGRARLRRPVDRERDAAVGGNARRAAVAGRAPRLGQRRVVTRALQAGRLGVLDRLGLARDRLEESRQSRRGLGAEQGDLRALEAEELSRGSRARVLPARDARRRSVHVRQLRERRVTRVRTLAERELLAPPLELVSPFRSPFDDRDLLRELHEEAGPDEGDQAVTRGGAGRDSIGFDRGEQSRHLGLPCRVDLGPPLHRDGELPNLVTGQERRVTLRVLPRHGLPCRRQVARLRVRHLDVEEERLLHEVHIAARTSDHAERQVAALVTPQRVAARIFAIQPPGGRQVDDQARLR